MNENVKPIKIGDGKYLLVIKHHRALEPRDGDIAIQITEGLEEWWEGEDKFFSISVGDDADISVERVEDE